MTFMTHDGHAPDRRAGPGFEYRVYFAGIYLLCLPIAAAGWTAGLARPRRANPGVHARAAREARAITPMIFSA